MQWLYRLERKYGRFAVPNLMIYITLTMLAVYILQGVVGIPVMPWLAFSRAAILRGQIWRLITFVFSPPGSGVLTVVIALYFYYFIGSSLENAWGAFQFNVYYLFGILGAIIAGFISGSTTNTYLNLSLFLAFAQLYPEQRVLLFFIIPVKVKWLAWADWALFGLQFLAGVFYGFVYKDWSTCAAILMSLLNFFLFFGPGFADRWKNNRRYSATRRNWRREMGDKRW